MLGPDYSKTRCLKEKNVAKLNSKEWTSGDAQLDFPGRKKLGTILLNKK